MIDEEQVYKEFEKALEEALQNYQGTNVTYEQLNIFIEDRVWNSLVKYNRMQLTTKEKFFSNLYERTAVDEYTKAIVDLWNIDHRDMDQSIKELQRMVIQRDLREAELYGDKKVTERSIKLENTWKDFTPQDKELYTLTPERDFTTLEQRYVNRHIKLYKNMLKRYKDKSAEEIAKFVREYDKIDKTIPYFAHNDIISKTTGEIIHKKGDIIHYVDVGTYLSMLYNVNLTRSAWNRAIYDAKLLGNHLWYLPAHPLACPHCAFYQGYVYTDHAPTPREQNILRMYGKPGYYYKEDAIEDKGNTGIGIGHPNCKHVWVSYWSQEQIQDEKYDSSEWEEQYKTQQKIQSLDLQKSRLLADRRIYKELGQQDLVDKTTAKIKTLREKKKDLENLSKGIYTNKYQQYKNDVAKAQEKIKQKEIQKIAQEKELKRILQKQSSATHKEMQELFKIRENRPKYIEQLERKQQELKEVRKIINQNNKDMKYWEAKQQELSLKVDIKNLKELINK